MAPMFVHFKRKCYLRHQNHWNGKFGRQAHRRAALRGRRLLGGALRVVQERTQARLFLYQDRPRRGRGMGLLVGGGYGDGHSRGGKIWLPAAGGGLPPRVLGPGDEIHDGQGEGRPYPQSRRDVQPPHQVWRLRREGGARLRPDSHGPLCPDRDRGREEMAGYQSRPGEGPDRLPGADRDVAVAQGPLSYWPLYEGRGARDSRARASRQCPPQGLAGHLLPWQDQLQRLYPALSGRQPRQGAGVGDGQADRPAPWVVVPHHRPAPRPWVWWWTMVCGEEGCGEERALCEQGL